MSGSEFYIPKNHVQPCWYCTKACGRCSWSKNFTPIKGWVAEKVIVDTKNYIFYIRQMRKVRENDN